MAPYGKSPTKSGTWLDDMMGRSSNLQLGRTNTGTTTTQSTHNPTHTTTGSAYAFEQLARERQSQQHVYDEDLVESLLHEVEDEMAASDTFATRLRSRLAHIILTQRFEMCIGTVILLNFVVIALETDARARQQDSVQDSLEHKRAGTILSLIAVAHTMFLIAYTVECGVRLYILRLRFFRHYWNNFDLFMVVTGLLAEIFEKSSIDALDGLRILRILRMLRTTKVLVCFDELYALVSGLTHALKALMWAALLMLMVLTIWSIFAVEYVKPLMAELAVHGAFGTCSWCPSAFDNVFLSNLTFFQIVSGDGWSQVARPLIEKHHWTALLFIAIIFSMVFGLLNLIVAVIVDSAHQAREADIANVGARKKAAQAAAWDCFNDMVGELDKTEEGEITVDVLRHALDVESKNSQQLSSYLTAMGVELSDLDLVFELLDSDGDGKLTQDEFTSQLYQMKTQELPITLAYVKNSVCKLQNELDKASEAIQTKLDQMLSPHVDGVASNHKMTGGLSNTLSQVDAGQFCENLSIQLPQVPALQTGEDSPKHTTGARLTVQRISEDSPSSATGKKPSSKKPILSVSGGRRPPTLRGSQGIQNGKSARNSSLSSNLAAPMRVSVQQPGGAVVDISSRFSNVGGNH